MLELNCCQQYFKLIFEFGKYLICMLCPLMCHWHMFVSKFEQLHLNLLFRKLFLNGSKRCVDIINVKGFYPSWFLSSFLFFLASFCLSIWACIKEAHLPSISAIYTAIECDEDSRIEKRDDQNIKWHAFFAAHLHFSSHSLRALLDGLAHLWGWYKHTK